jgi:hypothetical protein
MVVQPWNVASSKLYTVAAPALLAVHKRAAVRAAAVVDQSRMALLQQSD